MHVLRRGLARTSFTPLFALSDEAAKAERGGECLGSIGLAVEGPSHGSNSLTAHDPAPKTPNPRYSKEVEVVVGRRF